MHKIVTPTRFGTRCRDPIRDTRIAILAGTAVRRFLKEKDQYVTIRNVKAADLQHILGNHRTRSLEVPERM